MPVIKTIGVYCGTSEQADPSYKEVAARTGELLAKSGFNIVYGGVRLGLMGILASNALANGGYVTGIIPSLLTELEGAHPSLSEIQIVDTMHTRKQRMSELADAFIILPGGFGTLDELFEVLTWRQLQLHDKPIIIVNTMGYWAPLKALVHNVIEEKFAAPGHANLVNFVSTIDEAIDSLTEVSKI